MSEYRVEGGAALPLARLAACGCAAPARLRSLGGCGPPALRSASRARVVPRRHSRGAPAPLAYPLGGSPRSRSRASGPPHKCMLACVASLRFLLHSGPAAPGPLPLRSSRRERLARRRYRGPAPPSAAASLLARLRGRAPAVPPGSPARPLVRRVAAPRGLAPAAALGPLSCRCGLPSRSPLLFSRLALRSASVTGSPLGRPLCGVGPGGSRPGGSGGTAAVLPASPPGLSCARGLPPAALP